MCMFVYLVLSVIVIIYRALGFGRVPPCTGRLLNVYVCISGVECDCYCLQGISVR